MSEDTPEPRGWENDWRLAFPERFLKHQHLRGQDVTLTISKVVLPSLEMVNPGQRPKKEWKMVISFRELEKRPDIPNQWLPAKICCRTIEMMYGKSPKDWVGKRITIYPDPEIMKGKDKVGGIRVRSKVPSEKQQPARSGPSTPQTETPAPTAGPVTPEEAEEIARLEREQS